MSKEETSLRIIARKRYDARTGGQSEVVPSSSHAEAVALPPWLGRAGIANIEAAR
jgi:hypothetical protein